VKVCGEVEVRVGNSELNSPYNPNLSLNTKLPLTPARLHSR